MDLNSLFKNLDNCMQVDRHRFRQRLLRLQKQAEQESKKKAFLDLDAQMSTSVECAEIRRSAIPEVLFPEELPINGKRAKIMEMIADNQVVIICGETGSGKSTQLPKICLAMGRGVKGLIGHTQPRRIAARTIAGRVAEELRCVAGREVGYKIRFNDHVGPQTFIKLMTDGILLAETQSDRFLNAYDTIIIDEAHERSLNIDFLMGYLKTLLPRRPELKVIITSATIDPEKFSRHFNDAPIIEVSGRTYPVELHYRPLIDPDNPESEKELQQGIIDAVDELSRIDRGDILIFLPGEREIRETTETLRKHHSPNASGRGHSVKSEIIPLYAKLSHAEQNKVFSPHKNRHIVLATNVAETSLTVPGIRYVIDPGQARISRYSPRSKVQRLPIENISQASANQRKGRCGRVSEGVCIRLYSEDDFNSRPVFTDPEIQRTSLASVILQLASLHFGGIEDFPFVDPPEGRYINDGYKLLEELGAVDPSRKLTATGKKLARLPVDPRIGRMILAAHDQHCLEEVLIIASALSVQDVRDKPMEKMLLADEAHARFAHDDSDFCWFLNVWTFYHEQKKQLSQNKLRKLCRTNFLNYMRIREWVDIHSQLRGLVGEMKFVINKEAARYDAVHISLLSGLLGNIAFLSKRREYTGARSIKLNIFPGSGQFKKSPKWIVAAELAETSKLYGRIVAKIEPEWIIKAAGELVKRSHADAFWSKKAGRVLALEKTMLYGLTLSADRKVNYAPVDPEESRRLFLQTALVAGEINSKLIFLKHNQQLLNEIEAMEHRSRRLDILIDEQVQFDFYNEKIPTKVNNVKGLEKWYRDASKKDPQLLFFDRGFLIREEADEVCDDAFPESLFIAGMTLPLSYHFAPGSKNDGVTLSAPMAILNQLDPHIFEWVVPGLIKEKVTELIRSLPKQLRRNFVPAPNYCDATLNSVPYGKGSLLQAISDHLKKMTGIDVPLTAWDQTRLADHLMMNFKIVDINGHITAEGRDLKRMQGHLGEQVKETFSDNTSWSIECDQIKSWDFGDLPDYVETSQHGVPLRGYPALSDEGLTVSIRVMDTQEKAAEQHQAGLRKLIKLSLPEQMKYLNKNLPGLDKMCLQFTAVGKAIDLQEDIVTAILDRVFLAERPDIRSQEAFLDNIEKGQGELIPVAGEVCKTVGEVLLQFHNIRKRLDGKTPLAWLHAAKDIQEQLSHLIYPGFVSHTNYDWLPHIPRYLKAIGLRLDKLEVDPAKDKIRANQVAIFWSRYQESVKKTNELENYRWVIEELRVSLYAQTLGTSRPVSIKRLEKIWLAIKKM